MDWEHVAPVLRRYRAGEGEFVYFIGEPDAGPIKIGRAQHPIKRLRELQTGNPRRLRVERIVYGGADVEQMLHRYWQPHAIAGNARRSQFNPQYRFETEWFQAEARDRILAAAEMILERQETSPVEETFAQSVGAVMTELGHEVMAGDMVRLLGRSGGYVQRRLRHAS